MQWGKFAFTREAYYEITQLIFILKFLQVMMFSFCIVLKGRQIQKYYGLNQLMLLLHQLNCNDHIIISEQRKRWISKYKYYKDYNYHTAWNCNICYNFASVHIHCIQGLLNEFIPVFIAIFIILSRYPIF